MTLWLLAAVLILAACAPPGSRALVRGKKLLEAGELAGAVAALQTATTLLPTNAGAWNYLGVAYHRSGQWTNAADAYSRALRFDRDLLEARFNLGCLWLEQERWDQARAEFMAYTLRQPNDVEGWLKLGQVQLRNREGAAEKSFREALRVDADNPEAWNGLGLYYAGQNQGREAAAAFGQALQRQTNYAPALLNLATVLQQQLNDSPGALRRYRQYLALQPRPADWDRVNALVQTFGPPVPPATDLNLATATPNVPPVTNRTAAPLPATNQLAAARPVAVAPARTNPPAPTIQTAVTPEPVTRSTPLPPAPTAAPVKPTNAPAIASAPKPAPQATPAQPTPEPVRPVVVATPPQATNPASQATNPVVVVPGVADPVQNRRAAQQALARGQQEQRAGKPAEALQLYRRAVSLDPDYFEAHYLLGLAGFQIRNFKLAISAWETALTLRPNSADARYNYALALRAENRDQAAAAELEKLLALHPDEARAHLTLGNLYADQLRDIPRARRHYQRVLQLDPRNPQAQNIRFWLVSNPGS